MQNPPVRAWKRFPRESFQLRTGGFCVTKIPLKFSAALSYETACKCTALCRRRKLRLRQRLLQLCQNVRRALAHHQHDFAAGQRAQQRALCNGVLILQILIERLLLQ